MNARVDAFILPADDPANESEIKKSLLFFDSVTLPDPADRALLNDGDVVEKFPSMTFKWSDRNTFPRVAQYEEQTRSLLSNANVFTKKGHIRIAPLAPLPSLDPGVNYTIWHSAVADEALVRAAAPDLNVSANPQLGIAGYMYNLVISQQGFTSKYTIFENRPSFKFLEANDAWTCFAHLRVGRFVKYTRLAHALGIVPLAFDAPNQGMLATASGANSKFSPTEGRESSPDALSALALQLDVFDHNSLLTALNAMSWSDVARLRQEILPGVKILREEIQKATLIQRNIDANNLESYRIQVEKLATDFNNKKMQLAEEWEKLRIAAITKGGGSVGALTLGEASGLIAVALGAPWIDLLVKIFSTGLIATAAMSGDLARLIPARRKVQQHPLYFLDKIGPLGRTTTT